jgi:flagellin-like protein
MKSLRERRSKETRMKLIPSFSKSLNKRAVSPLIATVLLIVMAIAIFGIIFLWLRGMIAEQVQKIDRPIELQCDSVAFTAERQDGNIIVSNKGNLPIVGMNVKIKAGGKTYSLPRKPVDGVIAPGEVDIIDAKNNDASFPFISASKRTIAPLLQGTGKISGTPRVYACQDKAIDI